jgi:hypothetical protein
LDVAAGDGGGLSAVNCRVGRGAAGVRVEKSTGVGRTGSGCAIAGAGGGGTYIRSSGVSPSSFSSSSSSLSPFSPSSELIPPSSSNSGPIWCERVYLYFPSIPSTPSVNSTTQRMRGGKDVRGEQRQD